MNQEILLATFMALLEEKFASLPEPVPGRRGPRGSAGPRGEDGQGFVFADHEEKIKAFAQEFALKFSDLTSEQIEELRGPRGRDGKDFDFASHENQIKSWVESYRLRFDDLSESEIESLRGPRGRSGKDGARGDAGKDFVFAEHEQSISKLVADAIDSAKPDLKLKFEDLTLDEQESIRGRAGRDGRDGRDGANGSDFSLDEHRAEITDILAQAVEALAPELKLRFSDLSEEDVNSLRGPRGRDGRDGRDFNFEDHVEFFQSLKPVFADFTEEEKNSLKLRFTDLTQDEKDLLKLRFADLTADEKLSLRGARGPKGQRGSQGDSIVGPRGPRGVPGPAGISGLTVAGRDGLNGRDGVDGKDAPRVEDISIYQKGSEFALVFKFDNGESIRTNFADLPSARTFFVGGGITSGNGSGSGGSGADGKSAYEIWLANGHSGTETDFLASLVGPRGQSAYMAWRWLGNTGTVEDFIASLKGEKGDDGDDGAPGVDGKSAYQIWLDQGNTGIESDFLESLRGPPGSGSGGSSADQVIYGIACETSVYPGAAVRMAESNFVESMISEWDSLSEIQRLNAGTYDSLAINALADSYAHSNVIGLVESKTSPNVCNIRISGISSPSFYGLDVAEEYYLSDLFPGKIVASPQAPEADGHVLLKIGQPVSYDRLLIVRGERLVRGGL